MVTWKDFVKKAQMELFTPPASAYAAFMPDSDYKRKLLERDNPDSEYGLAKRHADAKNAIGMMRGVKEVVPGMIDFLIGNGSGLLNGLSGMAFGRPFHKGFYDSKNFTKKYYSDPIRKAEMAVGGNALRDMAYSERDNTMSRLREMAGDNIQKRQDLDDFDEWTSSLGDGMSGITQLYASLPMYSGLAAKSLTPGSAVGNPIMNFARSHNARWLKPIAQRVGPWLDSAVVASEGGAHASLGNDEYNKAEQELKQKYQMTPEQAIAELRRKYDAGMGTPEWRQRVSERFGW